MDLIIYVAKTGMWLQFLLQLLVMLASVALMRPQHSFTVPSKCDTLTYESASGNVPCVQYDVTEINALPRNITALELHIAWGHNITLNSALFDGMLQLQKLYLVLDGIRTLPDDLFKKLVALETLHVTSLHGNDSVTLSNGTFWGLAKLTRLGLRAIGLTYIPPGSFADMSHLSGVTFENNHLNSIVAITEMRYSNLTWLDLSRNNISALPALPAETMTNLITVNVSGNCIDEIPGNYFNHTSLLHLIMEKVCVSNIYPGSFHRLNKLQVLSLRDNMLQYLGAETFAGLDSLISLDLSRNNISVLESRGFSLRSLQNLNLSHNHIKWISSEAFWGLSALKSLYLQGNELSTINDSVFATLGHLVEINLGENRLVTLGEAVFTHVPGLNSLILSNNQLREVSSDIVSALSHLIYMDISGNPWRCNCSFLWLLAWVGEAGTGRGAGEPARRLGTENQTICDTPPAVHGASLIRALQETIHPFCEQAILTYGSSIPATLTVNTQRPNTGTSAVSLSATEPQKEISTKPQITSIVQEESSTANQTGFMTQSASAAAYTSEGYFYNESSTLPPSDVGDKSTSHSLLDNDSYYSSITDAGPNATESLHDGSLKPTNTEASTHSYSSQIPIKGPEKEQTDQNTQSPSLSAATNTGAHIDFPLVTASNDVSTEPVSSLTNSNIAGEDVTSDHVTSQVLAPSFPIVIGTPHSTAGQAPPSISSQTDSMADMKTPALFPVTQDINKDVSSSPGEERSSLLQTVDMTEVDDGSLSGGTSPMASQITNAVMGFFTQPSREDSITPLAVTENISSSQLLTSSESLEMTTAELPGINVTSYPVDISLKNASGIGETVNTTKGTSTFIQDLLSVTQSKTSTIGAVFGDDLTSHAAETSFITPDPGPVYNVTSPLGLAGKDLQTTTVTVTRLFRITTAYFNQSLQQENVIILTSGQRAGLVAGVIFLAMLTILATSLGIYVRHKRLAYWEPDLDDIGGSDRTKLMRHSQQHNVPSILWDPETGPLDSLWQDNVIVEARGRSKKGKRIRNHAKLGYLNPIMEIKESEEDKEDPNHNDGYHKLCKTDKPVNGVRANGISYISAEQDEIISPVGLRLQADISTESSSSDEYSDEEAAIDHKPTANTSDDNLSFAFDIEMSLDMSQIIDEQFARQVSERGDSDDVSHVNVSGEREEEEKQSNNLSISPDSSSAKANAGNSQADSRKPQSSLSPSYTDITNSDSDTRGPFAMESSDIVNISFDCLNSTMDFSGDWTQDIELDLSDACSNGEICDTSDRNNDRLFLDSTNARDNRDITAGGKEDKDSGDHIRAEEHYTSQINEESSGVMRYDRPSDQLEKINSVSGDGSVRTAEAQDPDYRSDTHIGIDFLPHTQETPPSPFKAIGSIDSVDDELVNL